MVVSDRARPWLSARTLGMCLATASLALTGCGAADSDGTTATSQPSGTPTHTFEPNPARGAAPQSWSLRVTPAMTDEDAQVMKDFVAFTLDPTKDAAQRVPLSSRGAVLGLGTDLVRELPRESVTDPSSWIINPEQGHYEGIDGPFSALGLIRAHVEGGPKAGGSRLTGDLQASVGPHPHCVSPPRPAPSGLRSLRRLSLQPADGSTSDCLSWFSVDLFLDKSYEIVAITVDQWGP